MNVNVNLAGGGDIIWCVLIEVSVGVRLSRVRYWLRWDLKGRNLVEMGVEI